MDIAVPVVFDAAGYATAAIWVPNAHNGGGTYDPEGWGYPYRIVAHTIEGSANPGMIEAHQSPPQLWYRPATRVLYQTIPLSRSGFAMWQPPYAAHYTNKARAVQVEIDGFSADTADWPVEWLNNIAWDVIAPICRWVATFGGGGSIDLARAPAPGPIPGSASVDAPQRMTEQEWAVFTGFCSHRHIPGNGDRWDTGSLDTPRIAGHAALIIAGQIADTPGRTAPGAQEDDMAVIIRLEAPGDPQHGTLFATDGVHKIALASMDQVQARLDSGAARKQANGAAWANWSLDQVRGLATVDEWTFAGMPAQVAAAVGARVDQAFADLPTRIARAITAAYGPNPRPAPPDRPTPPNPTDQGAT